jgi:hypothetical protein
MPPSAIEDQEKTFGTTRLLRTLLASVLVVLIGVYAILSRHWPLVGDAQVIHYVSFLMDHGFAPYRQIFDMNMPGAYLSEHVALSIFGSSDFGWRVYDLLLGIITALGMMTIARPYDWLAGFAAAVIFALTHAADGPYDAGQRDQVMVVLLVQACAFLFESVRQRRSWLLFFFGFTSMFAAAIKPTVAPVGFALLIIAVWKLRRRGTRCTGYVLWSLIGFATVGLIVLEFLYHYSSTSEFFRLLRQVLPHYGTLEPPSWTQMVKMSLPFPVAVFVLLAVCAAFTARRHQNWEQLCLLVVAFFGAFSYFAQRKGFQQHRYTFMAFLVLWAAVEIGTAIRGGRSERWIAGSAIACCLLYLFPRELMRIADYPSKDGFSESLASDLTQLGTSSLQGNVQCLDIVDGCLATLFHLQLVQHTGATGDLLLFQPVAAPAVEAARTYYRGVMEQNPPAVYVMSNIQFGVERRSFDKVNAWSAFAEDLRSHYALVRQREFPENAPQTSHPGEDSRLEAYRIYIRKDSPLAARVTATEHHP